MLKEFFYAVDSNWLVQESPGLNPDCFANIKSFSEKMKTRSSKVTVQTLYRKLGEEKLDDNFFIHCLPPFLNVGTTFAFFHLKRNLPEREQF